MVFFIVVAVAIFMTCPVDDGAMYRAHEVMDGQQQEHPPMGSKSHVKCRVGYSKANACKPAVGNTVDHRVLREVAVELLIHCDALIEHIVVHTLGVHHHRENFPEKMRRMRVFFGIAVGVVHAVEDGIGSGVQVRRALCDPGKYVKEFFPGFAHRKHFMRAIAVQEKCLSEQGKVPVSDEKQNNDHSYALCGKDAYNKIDFRVICD